MILFIKFQDIEDINGINNSNLYEIYKTKEFNADFKKKFRDERIGKNGCSLLHLAAQNNRSHFFELLQEQFKIGM